MMQAEKISVPLRAVVYREGKWWIAHNLEMDVVAEGKTALEAVQNVLELSSLQIEAAVDGGDLESVFRSAPPEIWTMFSIAQRFTLPDNHKARNSSRYVDQFEARELAFA